jgi:nuclear pore complex protein Nup54
MVPALAIGFDDVQKRLDQQHRLSEAHSAKLAEIQEILKKIQLKDMLETATKLAEYKRKHMEAAQRVIKVRIIIIIIIIIIISIESKNN